MNKLAYRAKIAFANEDGDMYIGKAVEIIIVVVLGILLMVALKSMFQTYILPSVEHKLAQLFGESSKDLEYTPGNAEVNANDSETSSGS